MHLTADHSKQSNESLLSRLNFVTCITNNITTGYDQQNASASSFHTNFSMARRLLFTDLRVPVYVLLPYMICASTYQPQIIYQPIRMTTFFAASDQKHG